MKHIDVEETANISPEVISWLRSIVNSRIVSYDVRTSIHEIALEAYCLGRRDLLQEIEDKYESIKQLREKKKEDANSSSPKQ